MSRRFYVDTLQVGPHVVELEHDRRVVSLPFDAEGRLWDPTEEQQAALNANPLRQSRFALCIHEDPQAASEPPPEVAAASMQEPAVDSATLRTARPRREGKGQS